jgi:excisionase family DNA binding protein
MRTGKRLKRETPRAVNQTGEASMTMGRTTMDSSQHTTETPWRTVAQVCDVAQCGPKLVYREIAAGRLRAAKIGNRRDLRIHRDWIDNWLESCAKPVEVRPVLREVRR